MIVVPVPPLVVVPPGVPPADTVAPVWAPPPTFPPGAICCCTDWASSADAVPDVQVAYPPVETDRMLMDTPQTSAATAIGI
ncbi:MAG: hypothetical protein KY446_12355, partial [Proteobacteria bacterium]|nr:hypothetical protein [Pseudomonadota bacterium]